MINRIKMLSVVLSCFFYLINLNAQSQDTTNTKIERLTLYGGSSWLKRHPNGSWEVTSGFIIGMQYVSGKNVGILLDASYSRNPANYQRDVPYGVSPNSYAWNFYNILVGLKFETTLFKDCSLILVPQCGLGITSSPYLHYNYEVPGYNFFFPDIPIKTLFDVEVESSTRIGVATGLMAQLGYKMLTVGFRWLSCSHKYKENIFFLNPSTGAYSYSQTWDSSIDFFQMYIGVYF
jgi:hypothetical protein